MRDFQRSAVYKSESLPDGVMFESMNECKEYGQVIVNSDYWKSQKGRKRFTLKDGRGCSNATASSKGIHRDKRKDIVTLPKWARKKWVIIHEFSHLLTNMTDFGTSPHGAVFCKHYLLLVKELLGQDQYEMLIGKFNDNGVKYLKH